MKRSRLIQSKLKNVLWLSAISVIAIGVYVIKTNSLSFDGLVTQDHIAIAVPYEARVVEVKVDVGHRVKKGQLLAIVESPDTVRTLSEVRTIMSKYEVDLARLKARQAELNVLLPLAEQNVQRSEKIMNMILSGRRQELVNNKTLMDISTQNMINQNQRASLRAENTSLQAEIDANQYGLNQAKRAHYALAKVYNKGKLYATMDGIVGNDLAVPGQVLTSSNNSVASIYHGDSYVLAYLPDTLLWSVKRGDALMVSGDHQVRVKVDQVLPITAQLPPEMQDPNTIKGRGRLLKLYLTEGTDGNLVLGQKVAVEYDTSIFTTIAEAAYSRLSQTGN
jgi:multidrug resistance efflux pump